MHFTEEQVNEFILCSKNSTYFINKFIQSNFHQHNIIETYIGHNRVIIFSKNIEQTRILTLSFLLWQAIFNHHQVILITASSIKEVSECMKLIKIMYEKLPKYIRSPVKIYRKEEIMFDNGSQIISRIISNHCGRGLALSSIYIDDFSNATDKKARDFWDYIYPCLYNSKILITSSDSNKHSLFTEIWREANITMDIFGNEINNGLGKNGFKAITYP